MPHTVCATDFRLILVQAQLTCGCHSHMQAVYCYIKKTSEEVFFAYLISLRSITSDTSADTESAVSEKTQSAKNGII